MTMSTRSTKPLGRLNRLKNLYNILDYLCSETLNLIGMVNFFPIFEVLKQYVGEF